VREQDSNDGVPRALQPDPGFAGPGRGEQRRPDRARAPVEDHEVEREARHFLSLTTLVSPIDGVVTTRQKQVGERVRAVAAGLLALGMRPEDRVAIAASTRLEWVLADFGILCAGAATTTVYPTTPAADVASWRV